MRIGLTLALCSALALGACQSARFGGPGPVVGGPVYNAPQILEPSVAAPSGVVSSEPLPPLPGSGPVVADVPTMPSYPSPVEPLPTVPSQPQQIASVAPTSRSSVVGAWTAREAAGSCRIQLSSSPALDLYRASTSGCANRDLGRVNAWDFRDGEVYLYQPGGAVAARLRPGGAGMDGVLAKSGAPLSLSR
jgi:Protease inhibitor Inh